MRGGEIPLLDCEINAIVFARAGANLRICGFRTKGSFFFIQLNSSPLGPYFGVVPIWVWVCSPKVSDLLKPPFYKGLDGVSPKLPRLSDEGSFSVRKVNFHKYPLVIE